MYLIQIVPTEGRVGEIQVFYEYKCWDTIKVENKWGCYL